MKICICGGGALGHVCTGVTASRRCGTKHLVRPSRALAKNDNGYRLEWEAVQSNYQPNLFEAQRSCGGAGYHLSMLAGLFN